MFALGSEHSTEVKVKQKEDYSKYMKQDVQAHYSLRYLI